MKNRNRYTLLIGLVVVATIAWQSCTEKIDIKLSSTNTRCVIYGEITTDTTAHKVRITKSADYFINEPPEPISGATISITDGSSTFPLAESVSEPGNYYTDSDVYGVPGNTYTLNVSNVDLLGDGNLLSYTAYSELKPVSAIDDIVIQFNSDYDFWEIRLWATDPAETEDYYLFKAYINGVLYSDSLNNLSITDDKFFNGNNANGSPVIRVVEEDSIKVDDIISLDICGISKDYYNFIIEAQTMTGTQVPMFSGPPANVRTNINNGALGYFAAYSINTISRKVRGSQK